MERKIIQILLFEGGSVKFIDLAKFFNVDKNIIEQAIPEIKNLLTILELRLITNANSMEISLSEEINTLINKNKIEELKSDMSESSLQTLAVIIYKNKATKAEIDFVRGVDSVRSIKNLLTRGIIEKIEEKNKRFYIPSTECLRYMNLDMVENIEGFSEISEKLKTLIEGE